MAYKNLQEFVTKLEKESELIRIKEFANPILEITEITDRFSKEPGGGKALFFENTGTMFPVLTNSFGSYNRICFALGIDNPEELGNRINEMLEIFASDKKTLLDKLKIIPQLKKISRWLPQTIKKRGVCQQVIIEQPDLGILPVLKCWPADGGRFITLPSVHSVDPLTGKRNVGMYRLQILDSTTTGMHWHRHKTGARHYEEYKKLNRKMPIAVTLGGDPVYTYSATAPLPDNIDEYILAGFIRNKPVELVKCITQNIEVPSDVDIVIEGYVDPSEDLIVEGPFGDHTGFYSLCDYYPKFHVTCITHRQNAIYPATLVGIPPQEDAWIAMITEKLFFTPMKISFAPELIDLHLPTAGVAHNLAILKIQKRFPGHGFKVINSLWGAGQMMFNKVMIVIDENSTLTDYYQLLKQTIKNVRIPEDILFGRGPLDVLDHASDLSAYGGKLGIDATSKLPEENTTDQIIRTAIQFKQFENIELINESYLKDDISLVLVTFKSKNVHPLEVLKKISDDPDFKGIKLIIGFDPGINILDPYLSAWLCLSNIDPGRDCIIHSRNTGNDNCLLVDATAKTYEVHKFKRPWPNLTVSDMETIQEIDCRWPGLFTVSKIESPSRKYLSMLKSKDATAFKNKFE